MTPTQIVFMIVAAIMLISALMVVTSRRMMHAALWLVLTLVSVAVLFAMLEASFFAIVQVIIYVGAIAILIIFAIMLTRQALEREKGFQFNKNWWLAALVAIAMFLMLFGAFSGWQSFNAIAGELPAAGQDIAEFGKALVDVNGFIIPFEVSSVLLLAALIGAIFIASERKGA
ncbi:MAG: NADH-quinone oxidoreductase subunit J [Anaerolineaceae bacterium]|nr:NADH-quinone oxidoreductase subunit J [Anaerolineaceae bacterium]